jgi:hypothetical protein
MGTPCFLKAYFYIVELFNEIAIKKKERLQMLALSNPKYP